MATKQVTVKSPDRLFEALGTAMSQWQSIESTLYEAFHNILGTKQEFTSYLYYDTKSAGHKVELVEKLFRIYLGARVYSEKAESSFKRIRSLVDERNNLAHFCVQMAVKKETDGAKLFSRVMYFPYLHPSFEKAQKFEYRADDIFALGEEFMAASRPITELLNELFPSRTGPMTSPKTIARRPQRRIKRR